MLSLKKMIFIRQKDVKITFLFTTQLLKNQKRNLNFCAFHAKTHTLTLFGNVENKCCIFWLALGCCTLQNLLTRPEFCYFHIKILRKHMKNVKKQISDSVFGVPITQMPVEIYNIWALKQTKIRRTINYHKICRLELKYQLNISKLINYC